MKIYVIRHLDNLLIFSKSVSFATEGTSMAAHLPLTEGPSLADPFPDEPTTGAPQIQGTMANSYQVMALTPWRGLTLAIDEKTSGDASVISPEADIFSINRTEKGLVDT
ncbi:hypothetical protein Adt_18209 [Abeliophyllum distichum]|uniref:Uncharacterized protein n=1 Tax=Abeliophyllum distichum TaxID=126358 RepID=A0ABD1TIR0_9LAMI